MKKIFILNNDQDLIILLQMLLGRKYMVRSATDILKAPAIIKEYQPDLLIIDHFIGGHDIYEVVNSVSKVSPPGDIPFIIFSGSPKVAEKARLLGAAGYLKKPSSMEDIEACIDDFFKSR